MQISSGQKLLQLRRMYLIDTNVVSEARKRDKAHAGVLAFFNEVSANEIPIYLSAITVGELRRGVDLIRYRGDLIQAELLENWLTTILVQYQRNILPLDTEAAQVWGRLRVPHAEHEIDKQIAAIALVNDLIVVTRNSNDFVGTGVRVRNPFLHD